MFEEGDDGPNNKRRRTNGHDPPRRQLAFSRARSQVPAREVTLTKALEDLFNEDPVERWVPWGLPRGVTSGKIASGFFLSLPEEAVILNVAPFLAPHELEDYFATCKLIHRISRTESAQKLRLTACIKYFSILKMYADKIEPLVVGGWTDFIKFMTMVATKLQKMYHGFEVHPLHRTLVAEQIIGHVCNFQGLNPFHPNHLNIEENDDAGLYEANRGKQLLDLDDAFTDYGHNDYHLPHIHFGDLGIHQMWEEGSIPPRYSRGPIDTVHPKEKERVLSNLLPVILIYREEDDGNEIAIGFAQQYDCVLEQHVYQWEAGYNDDGDDSPTWHSHAYEQAEYPRSIVRTFCLDMHKEHSSNGYYRKHVRELAWLWAHRIGPFDDEERSRYPFWQSVLGATEEKIERDNQTNYGTDDPFGRKKEDDALFSYVRSVLSGSNPNYLVASPEDYSAFLNVPLNDENDNHDLD